MQLAVDSIRTDGGTQSRAQINWLTVTDYAADIAEGATFPPVVVYFDGADYWLADGFHRLEAHKRLGLVEIAADVKQGTRRDAILYSVKANAIHGLRRTNDDKRRAVTLLLEDEEWLKWSDREIARQCGVSHPFVVGLRKSLVTITSEPRRYRTKHGTETVMNTANIGKRAEPVDEPDAQGDLLAAPPVEADDDDETPPCYDGVSLAYCKYCCATHDDWECFEGDAWMCGRCNHATHDSQMAMFDDDGNEVERYVFVNGHWTPVSLLRLDVVEEEPPALAIVPPAPPEFRILHGDMREVMAAMEPGSIDVIITDPPYPREFIHLYGDLARLAAHVLKPGGSLLAMAGQSYIPDLLALMTPYLRYHWLLSYLTPGGQSPQIWPRKINTFWKPVLWFVNGEYAGDWHGDVIKSAVNDNDKRFHHWGQSESGMGALVEKFTAPSDVILDPFCGGGVTGKVALDLGRGFIGIDTDTAHVATTLRRMGEAYVVASEA